MLFCSSSIHLGNFHVHFEHHDSSSYRRIVLVQEEERAQVERLDLIRIYFL